MRPLGRLGVAIPDSGGSELGAAQRPPESLGFIDAAASKKGQGLITDTRWVPSPSWRCREPETSGTLWRLEEPLGALPWPAVRGQAAQGGRGPQWLCQGPGKEQRVGEGPGKVSRGPSDWRQSLRLDADRRRGRGGPSAWGTLLAQTAGTAGEREGGRQEGERHTIHIGRKATAGHSSAVPSKSHSPTLGPVQVSLSPGRQGAPNSHWPGGVHRIPHRWPGRGLQGDLSCVSRAAICGQRLDERRFCQFSNPPTPGLWVGTGRTPTGRQVRVGRTCGA